MNVMEWFQDSNTTNIRGVEIFRTGTHNGKTFEDDDLERIVESFNRTRDELKPMLKLGHRNQIPIASGMPAVGWVSSLRKSGDTLLADFENVPAKVAEMINQKLFRRVSSEFLRHYLDEDGNRHDRVLKGVALLGADIPAVKTLDDVSELLDSPDDPDRAEAFTMEVEFDDEKDNDSIVELFQQIDKFQEAEVHRPTFNQVVDREWSKPTLSDFDTDDLSEISKHFVGSKTGFPPGNFGELFGPVVDTDNTLVENAVDNLNARLSQVSGVSSDTLDRAQSIVNGLQQEFEENGEENNDDFDSTQEGGQNVTIDEIVEAFSSLESGEREEFVSELSDDETETLRSVIGVDSDPVSDVEEFVSQLSEDETETLQSLLDDGSDDGEYSEEYVQTLEERVQSLESQLQDDRVENFLDEKIREGYLLDKNRDGMKQMIQSLLNSEEYTDESEAFSQVEQLIESTGKAVETDEFTEERDAPPSGPDASSEDVDETVDAIMDA